MQTTIKSDLSIDDLSIIWKQFRLYLEYEYKVSVAASFAKKDGKTCCKLYADTVYRDNRGIEPRVYTDRFKTSSLQWIPEFENLVQELEEDQDVLDLGNTCDHRLRKEVLKRSIRKYLPKLAIIDARKQKKENKKTKKALACKKKAAQQSANHKD